jgi:chemotaxis protein methyltransferase CheR
MNMPANVELTDEEFGRFRELIYRLAGIHIPPNKRVLVSNRVRRRLRATGIETFASYFRHVTSPDGAAEQALFLDAITTNETYFYRDPHHYEWFADQFLPEITRGAQAGLRSRRLRVWSAACSTGEELYSLILLTLEHPTPMGGWSRTFLGTDLSPSALATAKAATYEERALRLVPKGRRDRFFTREDGPPGRWTLRPEARALATWKSHNLMRPLNVEPFDCIVLKNVLIYFDIASKKVVLANLLRALAPGGYLVVGPTEGVGSLLTIPRIHPWLYRRPAEGGGSAPSARP